VVRQSGLGKGLKALIPIDDSTVGELMEVEIDLVFPNPHQPRRHFDEEKLHELAQSIKENGVIQPLVVRKVADRFEIIAGERRWRASKLSGIDRIPVLVKPMSDLDSMKIALLENLQREDLNPIEEAEAYKKLIDEFNMTQEALADSLGRSRPTITNSLRLLSLTPEVRDMVQKGLISMGHARALLTLGDASAQVAIAKKAIDETLSVRDIESIVQGKSKNVPRGTKKTAPQQVPHIAKVEEALQSTLGTKVRIKARTDLHGGKIEIDFFSPDELERLIEILVPHGI
jgi:ParB family chromosome partitioning protein